MISTKDTQLCAMQNLKIEMNDAPVNEFVDSLILSILRKYDDFGNLSSYSEIITCDYHHVRLLILGQISYIRESTDIIRQNKYNKYYSTFIQLWSISLHQ